MSLDAFDQIHWSKIEFGQIVKFLYEFKNEDLKPRRFLVIQKDDRGSLLLTCSMTSQIQKFDGKDAVYLLKEDQHSLLTKDTIIRSDEIIEVSKQTIKRFGEKFELGEKIPNSIFIQILKSLNSSEQIKNKIKKKIIRPLIEKIGFS